VAAWGKVYREKPFRARVGPRRSVNSIDPHAIHEQKTLASQEERRCMDGICFQPPQEPICFEGKNLGAGVRSAPVGRWARASAFFFFE
jgi:hypothetical protein